MCVRPIAVVAPTGDNCSFPSVCNMRDRQDGSSGGQEFKSPVLWEEVSYKDLQWNCFDQ